MLNPHRITEDQFRRQYRAWGPMLDAVCYTAASLAYFDDGLQWLTHSDTTITPQIEGYARQAIDHVVKAQALDRQIMIDSGDCFHLSYILYTNDNQSQKRQSGSPT